MADDETGEAIDARARVVARARAELGVQDPNKYYRDVAPAFIGHPHDKAWCGVFALWCYVKEELCDWTWTPDGAGFVHRLQRTQRPEPGDVVVIDRTPSGVVLWHHAIVTRVDGWYLHTVDGNALPYPLEGVDERVHAWGSSDRYHSNVDVYSIEGLISS